MEEEPLGCQPAWRASARQGGQGPRTQGTRAPAPGFSAPFTGWPPSPQPSHPATNPTFLCTLHSSEPVKAPNPTRRNFTPFSLNLPQVELMSLYTSPSLPASPPSPHLSRMVLWEKDRLREAQPHPPSSIVTYMGPWAVQAAGGGREPALHWASGMEGQGCMEASDFCPCCVPSSEGLRKGLLFSFSLRESKNGGATHLVT